MKNTDEPEMNGDDTVFPNVFVTVGTTFYDDLITWALAEETRGFFLKLGVQNVKLQIGSSRNYFASTNTQGSIVYELYNYKPNLSEDYEWADLVIGHAGAGTVLDVLDSGRTLFAIPNESLMDNHQIELGEFLHAERYAYSSLLRDAHSMITKIRRGGLKKFPSRNILQFHQSLEQTLNFDPVHLVQIKGKSSSK